MGNLETQSRPVPQPALHKAGAGLQAAGHGWLILILRCRQQADQARPGVDKQSSRAMILHHRKKKKTLSGDLKTNELAKI